MAMAGSLRKIAMEEARLNSVFDPLTWECRSGESTRLPSKWPRARIPKTIEASVSSLLFPPALFPRGFSPTTLLLPSSFFQFIYLFIYLFSDHFKFEFYWGYNKRKEPPREYGSALKSSKYLYFIFNSYSYGLTWIDVLPQYLKIVISVWSGLFMPEAKRMQQFVQNDSFLVTTITNWQFLHPFLQILTANGRVTP